MSNLKPHNYIDNSKASELLSNNNKKIVLNFFHEAFYEHEHKSFLF